MKTLAFQWYHPTLCAVSGVFVWVFVWEVAGVFVGVFVWEMAGVGLIPVRSGLSVPLSPNHHYRYL